MDVFSSGCHKWLFGPRGTGLVWGAPHAWERLAPTIPTFDGSAYVAWIEGRAPTETPAGALNTPGGFHSFEHRWALKEAFEFHRDIGRRQGRRENPRTRNSHEGGPRQHPGRHREDPDEGVAFGRPCVLRCFRTPCGRDRRPAPRGAQSCCSVTPYATQYLRFGPSIANQEGDVDRALEAVAAIVA